MDKNKIIDSISVESDAPDKTTEPIKVISDRRKALAKIGKFSAYVAPATVALVGNNAYATPFIPS